MSTSVCVSVCQRGYLRRHTRDLCQTSVPVAYGSGIAPSPWDFVTLPEQNRATGRGSVLDP